MNTGADGNAPTFRKGSSYVDLSATISEMYEDPAEKIIANPINSEKQALKEIRDIISKFQLAKEWDDQMALCQQLMSDVKGGACNYPLFVQEIPGLVPMLSYCVQNFRSTLVKFGCLSIVHLAQTLQEKFDSTASTLIGKLFPPTTHGTAIIACSCKCTILAIVKHCQGKFVLNAILSSAQSKSQDQRNIVSQGLLEVCSSWQKGIILQNIKQIEQALTQLSNDAGYDARISAKSAFDSLLSRNIIKAIPDSVLASQKAKQAETRRVSAQPTRQKWSSPQKKTKRKTGFEEESKTMVFKLSNNLLEETVQQTNTTTTNNNSTNRNSLTTSSKPVIQQKTKEQEIISNIRKYKVDPQLLKDNSNYVAEGLITCLKSNNEEEVLSALCLLNEVIDMLSASFIIYLDNLVNDILKYSQSQRFLLSQNASSLLTKLPSYFDGDSLLQITFLCEPSNQLLILFQSILRKDQNVLKKKENCINLLRIICITSINNQNETRYKAISLTIIENIKKYNQDAFQDFLENSEPQMKEAMQKLSITFSPMKKKPQQSQQQQNTVTFTPKISATNVQFSELNEENERTITTLSNTPTSAIKSIDGTQTSPIKVQYTMDQVYQTTHFDPAPMRSSFKKHGNDIDDSPSQKVPKSVEFGTPMQNNDSLNANSFSNISNSSVSAGSSFISSSKVSNSSSSIITNSSFNTSNKSASYLPPNLILTDIIKKLENSENKINDFQELKNYFSSHRDFSKDSFSLLANYIHSEYFLEAQSCIDTLLSVVDKEDVVSESFNTFLSHPNAATADFLTYIIKQTQTTKYTPKVKNVMYQLRSCSVDSDAELRKSSIYCIVELRKAIGETLDNEISQLPDPQKLIFNYYINKK